MSEFYGSTTLWTDAINHSPAKYPGQPHLADRLYHGPLERITIVDQLQHIGAQIAPRHPEIIHDEGGPLSDLPYPVVQHLAELGLERHGDIHRLLNPEALEQALYSERYFRARNPLFVTIQDASVSAVQEKGVRLPHEAVLFPPDEKLKIVLNAGAVAVKAQTDVLAHATKEGHDNSTGSYTEEQRKQHSSIAKTMSTSIRTMDVLDAKLQSDHDLLLQVWKAFSKPSIDDPLTPEAADQVVQRLDTILRVTVEAASRGLETVHMSEEEKASLKQKRQLALTGLLYCQGEQALVDDLLPLIEVAGRYTNARRGKIDESRTRCQILYQQNKSAIHDHEQAAYAV